jgi:hypothetical protein
MADPALIAPAMCLLALDASSADWQDSHLRHCEAKQSSFQRGAGLLRFARNDTTS